MATATIGELGPFDPKKESIETYLSRTEVWMKVNKVAAGDQDIKAYGIVGLCWADAYEVLFKSVTQQNQIPRLLSGLKTFWKNIITPQETFWLRESSLMKENRKRERVLLILLLLWRK